MYRRLPHNPNYYGLSDNIEETEQAQHGAGGQKVAEHLSELVEETMKDLHDSGCIDVSETEDVVTPMNLGMIATYYQAEYTTLEMFASSVRPNLRIREALEVLCAASEFERSMICNLRRGESAMIREQMKRIPMPVTSGHDTTTNTYDVHAKANVLMQTYLNQHHQDTSTASTVDRAKCLSVGVQLCKALVDVAAQSNQQNNGVGSLTTTLVCCELSQLLVQGMLPNDSLL
jgi:pre-mRNA-splicing helicase BRR2